MTQRTAERTGPYRSGSDVRSGSQALPATLAALLLLGLLLSVGLRPPAARPAIAPVDEFSASRATSILEHLLAEGVPHPVGSPANFVVRDRIIEHLEALEYEVDVQRAFSCRRGGGTCAPVENIVTRLAGSGGTARAVMLASHYDSRGAGPGAGDAGAAVAAILEVARIIRAEAPFRNDVILLLTDGEEAGLLGAEAFVAEHPWAGDVALVINMEARGTSGPSIMFETSPDNHWLIREFARVARRPVANSLTYDVYRLLPNDTDATVFMRAGMAAMNFAFVGELAHYHTGRDDVASLDPRTVQHHGENALAMVRRFASIPLQPQPGDAVYADFFGIAVMHWPAAWTLPLAVVFSLLIAAAAASLIRSRRLTLTGLLWALLAATIGLVVAACLGAGIGVLLNRVTGRPGVFHAHPQPALIALWVGTLSIVLLIGTLFVRRAGFWALFIAPWLLISLLAAAAAALLPGASVVLFIPASVGAGVIGVAVFGSRIQSVRPDIAAATAALGAGFSMIPLGFLLYLTFVLQLPVAISAVVGIAALPLLPLLVTEPLALRVHRLVLAGAAGLAGLALVAALLVPGYSEWRPRPLNVVYAQDAAGGSWWAVQGLDVTTASLPEGLRRAAVFVDTVPAAMPPIGRGPTAAAPRFDLPQPSLEVLAERRVDDSDVRIVTLRMTPAQPGNRMAIAVEATQRARIEGHPVRGFSSIVRGSATWIVHGVPAAGVLVDIEVPDAAARTAVAWDFAPGLPPAGEALLQARPARAAPFGDGDVTVTSSATRLPPSAAHYSQAPIPLRFPHAVHARIRVVDAASPTDARTATRFSARH